MSSENEPETSDDKKKNSKKESEDREEGSCCSIMWSLSKQYLYSNSKILFYYFPIY